METVTGFIGRASETDAAIKALKRRSNVLIQGKTGIGKSAFLKQVMRKMAGHEPMIWIGAGSAKQVIDDVAKQLHEAVGLRIPKRALGPKQLTSALSIGLTWQQLQRTIKRMSVKEVVSIISDTLTKKHCLIFIETLEVAPTLADAYAVIIEQAQVIAAIDETNRRTRIQKLLWKFQITIPLKPLTLDESEELSKQALNQYSVRFDKRATEIRFIRHVARSSGGIPTAINTMIEGASQEDEITPGKMRHIGHDAGTKYMDMTPFLILILIVFMAMRYVSKGIGEMEMMVVSGVGAALFWGVRVMMMSMRR